MNYDINTDLRPKTRVFASPAAAGAARIVSVNSSPGKGERKQPRHTGRLLAGHGLEGDGHAGDWHRQVSLLARESIERMRAAGLDVGPGDFAENLTTAGVDLPGLPVGTRLRVGPALLEVTQIGKRCHSRCEIYRQAGDCVMPREGIFARVLEGGQVRAGDAIEVEGDGVRAGDAIEVKGRQMRDEAGR